MGTKLKKSNLTAAWCDKMVAEGHRVYLQWDGGNDSGSVDFQVDASTVSPYLASAYDVDPTEIIEECYNVLDYGGWAWDFSATGEAHWSVEEQAFIGEDKYATRSETGREYPCDIKLTIPKSLWFHSLFVTLRWELWDEDAGRVEFMIQHGFRSPEHSRAEKQISDYLGDELEKVKEEAALHYIDTDNTVENTFGDLQLLRSQFTEEGDNLIFHIKKVDLELMEVTYKSVRVEFKNEDDEI